MLLGRHRPPITILESKCEIFFSSMIFHCHPLIIFRVPCFLLLIPVTDTPELFIIFDQDRQLVGYRRSLTLLCPELYFLVMMPLCPLNSTTITKLNQFSLADIERLARGSGRLPARRPQRLSRWILSLFWPMAQF